MSNNYNYKKYFNFMQILFIILLSQISTNLLRNLFKNLFLNKHLYKILVIYVYLSFTTINTKAQNHVSNDQPTDISLTQETFETSSNLGTLSIQSIAPNIDEEVMNAWIDNPFEMEETWFIRSTPDFLEILQNNINEDLFKNIKDRIKFTNYMTNEQISKVISTYGYYYDISYLTIPNNIKQQLPPNVLANIYYYLLFKPSTGTIIHIKCQTLNSAITCLKQDLIDPKNIQKIISTNIHHMEDNNYFIFYTYDIWSKLNYNTRQYIINYMITDSTSANHGLHVDLTINRKDDIRAIVQRYNNSSHEHEQIIARLEQLLKEKSEVTISIEELLPKTIQTSLHKAYICGGANCHQLTLSIANSSVEYRNKLLNTSELLSFLTENYVLIDAKNTLQAGDILIYQNEEKQIKHSAVYISDIEHREHGKLDALIVTKNGASKFFVPILQYKSTMEQIYADSYTEILIFRKKIIAHTQQNAKVASNATTQSIPDITSISNTPISIENNKCINLFASNR